MSSPALPSEVSPPSRYMTMSLLEDVREASRRDGICIRIDFTDKGYHRLPITFIVNPGKWQGLTDTQRQSIAEELMMKYWGEVADHRFRTEQARRSPSIPARIEKVDDRR